MEQRPPHECSAFQLRASRSVHAGAVSAPDGRGCRVQKAAVRAITSSRRAAVPRESPRVLDYLRANSRRFAMLSKAELKAWLAPARYAPVTGIDVCLPGLEVEAVRSQEVAFVVALDRKSTRLTPVTCQSRMPSSA